MMRESVEEAVRSGIVALAGLANQRTGGREDYEKVQRSFSKQTMKEPAAGHLRPQHLVHRTGVEL